MTPRQAAKILSERLEDKISRTTVIAWIQDGKLQAINKGRKKRRLYAITTAAIERFISDQRVVKPRSARAVFSRGSATTGGLDPLVAC